MTKAIIMAGGEGTRLRPITCIRAKPMVPVINKPAIEHSIHLLKNHGIYDITLGIYTFPENFQNYFGDGSELGVQISYSVEEKPLGTAGGVRKAIGNSNETTIILSGDGIIDFNISEILNFHKAKKSSFTIVLKRVKKPTDYGIVITNKDGKIERFQEKPSWSEVFTDTVNTGVYVIDPKLLMENIPKDKKFDFSLDLFPILKEKEIDMYGFITEGYWCDVGDLSSYMSVHKDILEGKVKIKIPGKKIAHNIWVGKDVEIDPEAKIKGPIIIGNFTRIKKGVDISEFSVIGDNCLIGENTSVKKSIIYHNTVIGRQCELRGAMVGKRCVLGENVSVYENAFIADDCSIGTGAVIQSGIKIWPDKSIEEGTRLTADLIWGQTEKKSLFCSEGISGTFNVKITPEFASKIGSATGAYLGKNSKVVISRDTSKAAALISLSLISGLLSMGVDVYNMEIETAPINRYTTKFMNANMGIYIQITYLTGLQNIRMHFFNQNGFQISINEEKKIENIFFRGDFPRKDVFETGKLIYPSHQIKSYIDNTMQFIDEPKLKSGNWKVILDCLNGTASYVFPELLDSMSIETTVLRGQIKETMGEHDRVIESIKSIYNVVNMSKMNREIGIIIDRHGFNITIVDEMGNILSQNDVNAILSLYYLKHTSSKTICIPVNTSLSIAKLIESNGGSVKWTKTKLRQPADSIDLFYGGKYKYPSIEQNYDPMTTCLRILEYLTLENVKLYEVTETLPRTNLKHTTIQCTTEEKAAIMGMISTDSAQDSTELIDGVKINKKNSWILLLPDASQPLIHIYAEGNTTKERDDLIEVYSEKITQFRLKKAY